MSSIFGILALVLAGVLAYLKPKGENEGEIIHQSKPRKQNPSEIINDWICIPKVKFGPFSQNFSESDILKIVGSEHLTPLEYCLDEEHTQYSSILFADTMDELVIDWEDDAPYKKIDKIRIIHKDSHWKTSEGIYVGISLQDLESINTRAFRFYGLEWEQSGLVSEWSGGIIQEGISVNLAANDPVEALPVLVGEYFFDSNQSEARRSDMEVVSLEILMS